VAYEYDHRMAKRGAPSGYEYTKRKLISICSCASSCMSLYPIIMGLLLGFGVNKHKTDRQCLLINIKNASEQ